MEVELIQRGNPNYVSKQFLREEVKGNLVLFREEPLFGVGALGVTVFFSELGTVINRTLHNNFSGLFYGLAYTKPNPDFVSSVEKKFSKDSKLLLVCQEGLRSGAAADKLEKAGFQNLAYISFGLQKVSPGIFEKEGPQELQDAGKGGLVTIQGKISTVLGSVLVVALLFVTFFPNQAEQWFFSK